MKTSLVQILFVLMGTIIAAALQDMLPAFGGAKPPVLLTLALFWSFAERPDDGRESRAAKRSILAARWIPAVLLAGLFEDALSDFPTFCSAGFFVLAGAAARFARPTTRELGRPLLGLVSVLVAAPLHELWLVTWDVVGHDPSGIVRFFSCTLPAAPTGLLVFTILPRLVHRAGFEGPTTEERLA